MEPAKINLGKSPGMLALGAYLVVVGLMSFIGSLGFLHYVAAILALVAGVLILIGK
jgi:hypothetical protein